MATKKELLLSLGLNDLEAEVYMLLLEEDSLTGYKIGKILGKPTANVYKAVDSLSRKGAVIVEDAAKSLCKAVPSIQFINAVEAGILRKTKEARKQFVQQKSPSFDEKTYQIQSVDLVFEKCISMLDSATKIVVIDAFPKPMKVLMPHIIQAIERGIMLFVQVYEPTEIPGANLIYPKLVPHVLQYWQSQQLNIVSDGKEHLLCLLNNDINEVYQATWSRNLYLSSMLYKGFSNEFIISSIMDVDKSAGYYDQVAAILKQQQRLSSGEIPGVQELLKRFGIIEENTKQ